MGQRVKKKVKEKKPVHLVDLPKSFFRSEKSKQYAEDIVGLIRSIRYTNEKVQYSSQICSFNIRSITSKSGFAPRHSEVFRQIEQFAYHYENFCFRTFVYREKILQFLNLVLDINYGERRVNYGNLICESRVKESRINLILERFEKNRILSSLIKDRNSLTHRIYYGKDFDRYFRPRTSDREFKNFSDFKKWSIGWKRGIMQRSRVCNTAIPQIVEIELLLMQKISLYKNKRKKIDKILGN